MQVDTKIDNGNMVCEEPKAQLPVARGRTKKPAQAPTVQAQPAPTSAMDLLRIVTERGATPEELGKFMDLLERQQANEAAQAYMRAITDFKRNVQTIYRDGNAAFKGKNKETGERGDVSYDFATLGHICEKIIVQMAEHRLSHRWTIDQSSGKIRVTCVLSHEQGHSETASIQYDADHSGAKNALQAVNSSITYGERTTLLAVCGIAVKSQGDDDGHAGGAVPETGNGESPPDDSILARARQAAAGGNKHFGPFWRGIKQEDRDSLRGQLEDLQKRANAADRAIGK